MKLATLSAHFVHLFDEPASTFSELQRALKEGSFTFANMKSAGQLSLPKGSVDPRVSQAMAARPGPGGGIDADPFHAAFFLLAYMLDQPRARIAEATWKAWHVNNEKSVLSGWTGDGGLKFVPCSLTKQLVFGEALSTLLGNQDLARRVQGISIEKSGKEAIVRFDEDKRTVFRRRDVSFDEANMTTTRTLAANAVVAIATLITKP